MFVVNQDKYCLKGKTGYLKGGGQEIIVLFKGDTNYTIFKCREKNIPTGSAGRHYNFI